MRPLARSLARSETGSKCLVRVEGEREREREREKESVLHEQKKQFSKHDKSQKVSLSCDTVLQFYYLLCKHFFLVPSGPVVQEDPFLLNFCFGGHVCQVLLVGGWKNKIRK